MRLEHMDDIPPEVLTSRQHRTLSVCEENIEKDLEQETQEPKARLER